MLIRHSLLYLAARGLPGVVSFIAIAIYTRLLPPEEYGRYAQIMAGVGLANAVLFQWLRLGLLRFLPAFKDRRQAFLSTLLAGFVALVVLTGVLGFAGAWFWPWHDPVLRRLAFFGVAILWIQAWYELNLELARSQLSPWRYGLLTLSRTLLALAIGSLLAYLGWGAAGLLVGMAVGMLLPVLLAASREWSGARFGARDSAVNRQLLIYGLPLTAAFALDFVVSSSDRLLIGLLAGSAETGLYAVGYDLAKQSLMILMMAVNLAAYPLVVRALEHEGIDSAREKLSRNAVALAAIALPAAVGFSLLSANISGVFLGAQFREAAAQLMPVVALGILMAGLKIYYYDLAFQLGRHTIGQVWVLLAAALLNLGLNLLWIPLWGYMGAAYATVAAYAAGMALSVLFGRRVFRLPFPGRELAKVLIASLVMAAALWPLLPYRGALSFAVQLAVGMLAYGAMLLLLNVAGSRPLAAKALKKLPLFRRCQAP